MDPVQVRVLLLIFKKPREHISKENSAGILANQMSFYIGMDLV